ncbi:16S rRNA (uracil(1498)-N(3))-methyltransferase [Aquibacillus sp. 3ASR75-11]|uniref:Ribosomal RNA small subunit methyltransferase E n=1 Tax=Terrihalobacillus insolitus TaxID=2950438 RepID=A0A9X3WVM9_9BACI|nr:16S rRNA (uracil(1498)-N(3))-methyltransferase [Terrihalobacillus insolitus]MDC3413338.1 16S rRNA (uracil(1498)-N(3))-methyltransferase [Terrihalobacillus insolitus]MDC3424921.1 16S rRNA (uracil(1498)-N(3))-methyltransferase [Terrihalobacillus insolitus]
MQRYFVSEENLLSDKIVIKGEDVHHIVKVMRMNEGDKIICNVLDGRAAVCQIQSVSDASVVTTVLTWETNYTQLPINVTIAQGLPKGDKLELVLQKGTELGAHEFLPFQAQRSIVKWDSKKMKKKMERYRKIVKEASEQSHRNNVPSILSVASFTELLTYSSKFNHKIVAFEEEARSPHYRKLSEAINQMKPNESILACVGPEGGFSDEEIQSLKKHGFHTVRLGPRILRTETAPLYLLACISYHFEELR